MKNPQSVTELIQEMRQGSDSARDRLFAATYPDLKKLAHSRLYRQGGRGGDLQTTSLVHETYQRFKLAGQLHAEDRRAYFAYAATVMTSVILDEVRHQKAWKNNAGEAPLPLDTQTPALSQPPDAENVHDALLVLEKADPKTAMAVWYSYFGGFTEIEVAEMMDVTERTVRRYLTKGELLLKEILTVETGR